MSKIVKLFAIALVVSGCTSQEPLLLSEEGATIDELKFALKMDPRDTTSRIKLGRAYVQQNQLRLAVMQFDSALALNPDSPHALFEKGRVLRRLDFEKEGNRLIYEAIQKPGGEIYIAQIGRELGCPYKIRQITDGGDDHAFATWTHDGKQLIFQSNRNANWDIYALAYENRSTERLTTDLARDEGPVLSHDGRSLAFTSTRNAQSRRLAEMQREIYLRDMVTGNLQQLTVAHSDDWHPVFSGDDTKLYYVSTSQDTNKLYVMNLETLESTPLTGVPPRSLSPSVSPEGTHLIFVTESANSDKLYEYDLLHGTIRTVTRDFGSISCPHYSPDGEKIAFAGRKNDQVDIFLILRDGSEIQQLTNDKAHDGNPCFSPDGNKIVFHSDRALTFHLFEIDLSAPATFQDLGTYLGNN